MPLRLVPGGAGRALGAAMALRLGLEPLDCTVERFPDGELRPRVGSMRGDDVYLIQSTGPPVGENLVELLLLLDACRRSGAERITAVVPYFGYARQDRRSRSGEAVGARAVADLVTAAGAQHLLVIDPHTPALEAMFAIPVHMVTTVPVLTEAMSTQLSPDAVVVAPDLGAVKLAENVAKHLSRAMATVRKARFSGSSVRAVELVGDVADRPVLIVDDMISTGATIEAAMGILLDRGAVPDLTVAAVHGPLVPRAAERLRDLPLRRIFVTDSTGPPRTRWWTSARSTRYSPTPFEGCITGASSWSRTRPGRSALTRTGCRHHSG